MLPIYLILHNIRSAYNVGSIFRTADGAGVKKIYLCGITPRPTTMGTIAKDAMVPMVSKISKTALGAEKYVSWEYYKQTWRLLKKLKDQGLKLVALEHTPRSKNIFEFNPPAGGPLALIVGNEVKGLSKKILSYCDEIIEIPMRGKKESLNVSVAAGIAIFKITERL